MVILILMLPFKIKLHKVLNDYYVDKLALISPSHSPRLFWGVRYSEGICRVSFALWIIKQEAKTFFLMIWPFKITPGCVLALKRASVWPAGASRELFHPYLMINSSSRELYCSAGRLETVSIKETQRMNEMACSVCDSPRVCRTDVLLSWLCCMSSHVPDRLALTRAVLFHCPCGHSTVNLSLRDSLEVSALRTFAHISCIDYRFNQL